jgi:hypothetical protein
LRLFLRLNFRDALLTLRPARKEIFALIAKAAALDINLTIDGDKVLIEATNKA